MNFDVFMDGMFLCHLPMWSREVAEKLREITSTFKVKVTMDLYSKRIDLL